MSAVANSPAAEVEELEDQLDIAAARLAMIETANEESVPSSLVDRLHDGVQPVRVWREYCEMSAEDLAFSSGVGTDVIEAIERGEVEPSLSVASRLADTMHIGITSLIPWRQD